MDELKDLLTPAEVADYMGVQRPTVWKWLKSGYLPSTLYGRSYLISKSDLIDFETKEPRHRGRPGLRHGSYIRVNGKPVKVTSETMPTDPIERRIMWETFFLEHPEFKKKTPGEDLREKLIVTGLDIDLKNEFFRMAESAQEYEAEQTEGTR